MYASYQVAREQQADRLRRAQARREARDAAGAVRAHRWAVLSVALDALRGAWSARPGAATPQAHAPRG